MSLRQGVTAPEEHKLKALISKGKTWDEIVARCQTTDEQGREQVPLLQDVDLKTIKATIYDPLVKKLEEAKKAGFKDIHGHETALKKKRDEAAAAKKAKEEE
jgi:hypothetical protein